MAPIALEAGANGTKYDTLSPPAQVVGQEDVVCEANEVEPIAIIGFSFKFPQEATTPDALWQVLREKKCAMTEWPRDRLNVDAFYHPDSRRLDTIPFRGGHFLEEPLRNFDAPFFSITSAEAAAMDPQQRLLLETAYRALENAGIPLENVSGSNTSVHTGCFTDDYRHAISRDPSILPTYTATGVAPSMLANRLSWFFNWTGPSVNLDSACSSSMIAFDVACQGLRSGHADMALVGGASVALALDMSLPLSNMNFLSPDSRSFSFDDRANGYGRGEGFGVVLLKRLTDALSDGDVIRAVVRATGSNQDGHTPGITQPSAESQLRLIRQTYDKAGLKMEPTRYVEAHGTGTAIGDPIEASAIGTAFRSVRSSEDPMNIGAIKSNVGHLEGTSGLAGIIKTIMVLEAGVIPPNTNFEALNPGIDAESLRVTFPQQMKLWPSRGLRRASVMSFGFGGSNSHVVMDDACNFLRLKGLQGNHWSVQDPPPIETLGTFSTLSCLPSLMHRSTLGDAMTCTTPKLVVWSAADEDGLRRLEKLYTNHLSQIVSCLDTNAAADYLDALSYTLAMRRTLLNWKSFVVAESLADLAHGAKKMSKAVKSRVMPKLGYVFTGQGAQFARMAEDLLAYPVFENSLRRSEMYLHSFGCQWSLQDELFKATATSNIDQPAYSQPICTAVQIALVDLLRRFGIVPSAVIGHSSGEIAAAYCMGYLSHRSACKVAFLRGQCAEKLIASSRRQGAMMAVGLSAESIEPYLTGMTDVVVGCVNSPRSVTVTGEQAQIDILKSILDRDSVFSRKLHVNVAYHSEQMSEVATDYLTLLGDLEQGESPSTSSVMISTVTGKPTTIAEVKQSRYWVENMVSQVKFATAVEQICSVAQNGSGKKLKLNGSTTHVTDLLEVGPHSALQGPIKDILDAKSSSAIGYLSVLKRSMSAMGTFLDAIGRLHCLGYPVDVYEVNAVGKKSKQRHMVLPTLPEYPFNHSRGYWSESRLSKEGYRIRQNPRLDLLGTPAPDWNPLQARWTNRIRASEMPWIEDHKVNGTVVYPAAGMLVMALEATKQTVDSSHRIAGYMVKDVSFHSPLTIANGIQGTETQLYLQPLADSSSKNISSEFRIYVYHSDQWNETCRGTILLELEADETEVDAGKEAKARLAQYRRRFEEGAQLCGKPVSKDRMYKYIKHIGLDYGPAFQALQQLSYNDEGVAIGRVKTFDRSTTETGHHDQSHVIHPTTLDALFQLMIVALSKGAEEDIPTVMPTRIGKLWIAGQGISHPTISSVNAHAEAVFSGRRKAHGGMFAMNETTNDILISLENTEVTTVATREAVTQSQSLKKRLVYRYAWKPDLELLSHPQVLEYCERKRPHRASEADFYQDLGFVLIMYLSDALHALTEQDLCCLGPHLHQYVKWSSFQLERFHAGSLPNLSSSHSKWISLEHDMEYREILVSQLESTKQGKFFVRIGRSLLPILKGELDPLAFMFQDGWVPEFYREINKNVVCYEPFNEYIDLMSHKNPGLKVLEVGAGTGATTDFMLDALSSHEEGGVRTLDCAHYDYTDLSPAFFESAATRFERYHGKMRFKVLDVETDPSNQGFELGTYDLILAASVLHATKNLEATMRNVRALLKPGGKIVVIEVTQDVIRARFAFGLLPGWWLSEETYRQQGPCISIKEWDNLLRRTGFSGVDLDIPDYTDDRCHEYTIMISTAIEPAQNLKTNTSLERLQFGNVAIIVDDKYSLQQRVARGLKDYFLSRRTVDCHVLSLEQVSSSVNLEDIFCLFLVEMETPLLSHLDGPSLKALQLVLTKAPGVLWVTGGGGCDNKPQLHLIDGLARVSRTEIDKLMFVTLALENPTLSGENQITNRVHQASQVLEGMMSQSPRDFESEYVENAGNLEIGRLVEASRLNDEIFTKTRSYQHKMKEFGHGPRLILHIESPGALDSLQFIEAVPAQALAPNELEIRVESTGVNFLDCLTALGQIDSNIIGGECAGIVSRVGSGCDFAPGDRVVSLIRSTYQTYTRAPTRCVAKLPSNLSFVEASALPVIFCTVWIALCDTARLQPGESILIHAGAGGTGQAAIQVAQYLGAEIFVTVGSDKKKRLVMDLYSIPEDHIFYSRDTSFAQGIMRITKDRGIDVVLNSLSGEGLRASWECLACLGRFIELGKRDIISHSNLPMWHFHKNVTFSSVDLLTFMKERPSMIDKVLSTIMTLVAEKKLHVPQPFQVFGIAEVESVFRLLQSGQNSGKMVIEMRSQDLVPTVLQTKPDYQFDADSTYLIVGGLGGLGRSAARWMAGRGAKNLVLVSRSGVRSETSINLMADLKSMGVQVSAPACDVADQASLAAVLTQCSQTMPPIRGVIQAAMVLKDGIFEKMAIENWKQSIEPKIQGSWNLHTLLPRGMDFFICFSSIAGIIGSGGQANYAAGNTFMDALVRHRVMQGEKATTLDLGWMESEGVVAESAFLSTSIAGAGHMIPITQADFHALLDYYCNPTLDLGSAADLCQAIIGPQVPAVMLEKGLKEASWMRRRAFRHLQQVGLGGPSSSPASKTVDYATLLRKAASLEDAARIVTDGLLHKLSRALSISPADMDVSKPLHAYGVDSLLAVELRNYFAKEFNANVAIFDITGGSSFETVGMTVARKSQFCSASLRDTHS